MNYTIRHICEILDGSFAQYRSDDGIRHLLLDSRRLIFPADSLFFALKGPSRDGRRFMDDLYKRGVRNFVVQLGEGPSILPGSPSLLAARSSQLEALASSNLVAPYPDANIIGVPDTLAALQQLAAWHRRQFSIPVVGITGSNGKTIVKEWLCQLLEDEFNIVRSPKSYNSQIGVPLSVWQLQDVHGLAVFEAGISRCGEMSRLEAIIRPTIGIFTNIGEAHSEGFSSLEEKTREKWQLFSHAQAVIYCLDQPETARAAEALLSGSTRSSQLAAHSSTPPRFFSWGRNESATLVIRSVEKKEGWTTVSTSYSGFEGSPHSLAALSSSKLEARSSQLEALSSSKREAFSFPFTDEASFENIMHCICGLLYFGLSPDKIRLRLQQLSPIAMRLELKGGINHSSIINDSYSADLSSLQIALDFLSQQHQHPRRTVILSDILESGRKDEELYAEVALALAQKKVDRLIGIGPRIGARTSVFGEWFPGQALFYPSTDEFRKDIHRLHFRDETILIKGARIFEFEEIDRLLSEQIHQTVLEINLDAMASNLSQYRRFLQPTTRIMAMVKAFSYGSGSFEIANLLQFHGVDYLGVAYADEGVALRKAGIRMPIMVMNTENSSYDSLVEYNLEPVIYSFGLFHSFDKWLKKEAMPGFPVHIELETGMNRLGFPLGRLGDLAALLRHTTFKVQSVFTHLAASEELQQDDFSREQGQAYLRAADSLQHALGYPFLRHIANSAAIIRHPGLELDMVRLGIGLYGIDSSLSHRLELREVSTLKSTIAQLKQLEEGDTIGYNRKGVASAGMIIATVRIGYADGYPRSLGNGNGKMWVRGRLAPVIGCVCMDMTMIDITGIPDVAEGDEVIVFGNELSVNQLAHWAQTIPYEILTGVSQRVRRIYFEE